MAIRSGQRTQPEVDVNKYLKFIIAALGAAVTVVQTVWPTSHWAVVATTVATAILVYLTPNAPKS